MVSGRFGPGYSEVAMSALSFLLESLVILELAAAGFEVLAVVEVL